MTDEAKQPGRDAAVSLREITKETLRPFLKMNVTESQKNMVAKEYQGLGYGRKAIEQLVEYVKTRPNAAELKVSHVKDLPGNPGPFYEKLGFEYTGEVEGSELVMNLALS